MFHLHDVHHGECLLEFWRSVSTTHQLKAAGLVTGPVALDRTFEVLLRFYQFSFQKVGCRYIAG